MAILELVKEAEALSKTDGKAVDAWNMIEKELRAGEITGKSRYYAGWVIFRLISATAESISDNRYRRLLADYISIADSVPSALHSAMLRKAIDLDKRCEAFDFHRFFIKWNPALFRTEDYQSADKNGKTYPALATLAFARASGYPESGGLAKLLPLAGNNVNMLDSVELLKVMRRRLCHDITVAAEKGDMARVWSLFDEYAQTLCTAEKSGHHSRALDLACKYMNDSELWRFPKFFRTWLIAGFRDEDRFPVTGKDGKKYPGTMESAMKQIFTLIKSAPQKHRELVEEYLPMFAGIRKEEMSCHWPAYRYARMLLWHKEPQKALVILRSLRGTMSGNWYYYADLAECTDNLREKTSLLSKALFMMRDKRFSAPIHLELASIFMDKGLMPEAAREMQDAVDVRKAGGHNTGGRVEELSAKLRNTLPAPDNTDFLRRFSRGADEFLYSDLEWEYAVVDNIWTSDKGREVVRIRTEKGDSAICPRNRFRMLRIIGRGNRLMVKVERTDRVRIVFVKPDGSGV